MARTKVGSLSTRNFAAGSYTVGPHSIPDSAAKASIWIARCTTATPTIWPSSSVTLSATLQCSLDSGVSWIDIAGFSASGGIAQERLGGELTHTSLQCPFPEGVDRLVRALVTIAGGTLRTSVSVEVL